MIPILHNTFFFTPKTACGNNTVSGLAFSKGFLLTVKCRCDKMDMKNISAVSAHL